MLYSFLFDNVGLRYNALGFIFLRIRELSSLQWHPFSVSSSPLDGKYHISVLIKAVGDWTTKLRGKISNISTEESRTELSIQPHSKITASVEGPYGHESPYHLMYVLYSSYIVMRVTDDSGCGLITDLINQLLPGRKKRKKKVVQDTKLMSCYMHLGPS